ncbi:hypothetical protein VTK73DRAFT_7930 [Phialemonium thermophilum]|uniref:NAD(P)-binding domain-containing protein n=1 Tax=Phialemonium thermophilum TaxID=223376 RepID=A0ABR3WBV7_9PEZI
MSASSSPKALLFLGATGGCGLSALRRSLEAGHNCVALCRTPAKLTDKLPSPTPANLRIEQGNAHNVDDVARCLVHPTKGAGHIVDAIVFSIGLLIKMPSMTLDDPHVCETGIRVLLEALARLRAEYPAALASARPRIHVLSTTGITELGRDVPLAFVPMYHVMLKVPHKDKVAMERRLVASAEDWTFIRPSLLTDGPSTDKDIRVGIEDPVAGKVESKALGYTISREDVGRWIFENLIQEKDDKYVRKAATITY